jgi:hypothetical protein
VPTKAANTQLKLHTASTRKFHQIEKTDIESIAKVKSMHYGREERKGSVASTGITTYAAAACAHAASSAEHQAKMLQQANSAKASADSSQGITL